MRIGNGYDVHKLTKDRPLIIGGEKIAYDMGLEGHSDADVLVHAIIDALLGAAALGDIGSHFPDTDIRYKNISSLSLLKEVSNIISQKGYYIANIDSVVIAQKPKLAQYITNMRQNIAACLNIDINKISVKAKTEEGLGFTGQGLGIAAHSVCLIDS